MAGKPAYTNEQIVAALKKTNGLVSLAARDLGCTPQTIYNRAKSVKMVQEAIDENRDALVDYAELALRSAVIAKDPWAVQFVLKTLGKKRGYVDRVQVEKIDVDLTKLTDNQLDRLLRGDDIYAVLSDPS